MRRLLVLHNAMREGPLGEELMPLFFTSPLAKRQRRSASAAAVGKVDVQAVAESIADCCAPSPRALEACHRAVQAVLDGETSTLDLEGLSLDELPHALLHLRVDAVLADTERLSEDEASLLRGLGEPGGWDAALAYLKERAERRLQLLGEIDAAQAEALKRMTEGRVSFFYPGSLRHGPSKPPPRSR